MSFYGSTPNYAFIWDEAGFEGTTARIREKQKAGDFKGMAAQITDEHIATFATESTWDGLADALIDKYGEIATRIVLYNALGDHERFERYGAVARSISTLAAIRHQFLTSELKCRHFEDKCRTPVRPCSLCSTTGSRTLWDVLTVHTTGWAAPIA